MTSRPPGLIARPELPGGGTSCLAPSASLFLDQRGFARACAANHDVVLGNVAHHRLLELWRGPVVERLRNALAQQDHSLGCGICAWQIDGGTPEDAYARAFDELAVSPGLEWPTQLELALGNDCNLQCTMCNGEQSSMIRSRREHLGSHPAVYGDDFFTDLAEVLPHLHRVKFLGGEPFLVPEHHRVWDMLSDADLEVPCHITTNGTVWNDRVERVLERHPVSLAVSMDGVRPATVAAIRVGAQLRTILRNLERFCAYASDRGTEVTLTFALMRANWRELWDFLRFADDLDLSVWVNSVYSPRRLSLYWLDDGDLAEVVERLVEAEASSTAALGRNARVWHDQLSRLRHRLEARRRRDHASLERRYDTASVQPLVTDPAKTDPDPPSPSVLAAWAHGGPVASVRYDAADRVVVGDVGGSFLAAPLDVVGFGADEIGVLLESLYGRLAVPAEEGESAGSVDRVLRFEDHEVRTEVRIVATPVHDPSGTFIGTAATYAARSAGPATR
jgi:MoaA/NifB/PqqE/SkfB family radical SAM enzyme